LSRSLAGSVSCNSWVFCRTIMCKIRITNDLWARINTQIIADMSRREEDDRTHYGKMRATIERRVRGRQ
jgi:hypothetical protein